MSEIIPDRLRLRGISPCATKAATSKRSWWMAMSSQLMRKAVVISRVGGRLALRLPIRCCSSLCWTCRTITRNRLKYSESLLKSFLRLAASKDFLFPKLRVRRGVAFPDRSLSSQRLSLAASSIAALTHLKATAPHFCVDSASASQEGYRLFP